MRRLLSCLLGLFTTGCGSIAYYEVVEAEPEAKRPELLDEFRDSPRDAIPSVELASADEGGHESPADCIAALDTARAHVLSAIETAIAIKDTRRSRCLARSAHRLRSVKNLTLTRPGAETDALACEQVPWIIESARACQ